jgi:LysM repeat protein
LARGHPPLTDLISLPRLEDSEWHELPAGGWVYTDLPEQQLSLIMVFEGQVSAHPVLNADTYDQGAAVDIVVGYFWFSTPGATAEPIAGLAARELHSFDQLLPVVEELNLWQWIERITLRADMDGIPYPAIPPFVLGPTLTPSLETATLISQLTSLPPTPTATPCGPPPNWGTYVVQADDTLFSLAAKAGTSVERWIAVAVIGLLGASLLVYTLIQNRGREPLD